LKNKKKERNGPIYSKWKTWENRLKDKNTQTQPTTFKRGYKYMEREKR
jgi:hypothetical protein